MQPGSVLKLRGGAGGRLRHGQGSQLGCPGAYLFFVREGWLVWSPNGPACLQKAASKAKKLWEMLTGRERAVPDGSRVLFGAQVDRQGGCSQLCPSVGAHSYLKKAPNLLLVVTLGCPSGRGSRGPGAARSQVSAKPRCLPPGRCDSGVLAASPSPRGEAEREKDHHLALRDSSSSSSRRRRPCFLSRNVAGIKDLKRENYLICA